MSKQYQIYYPSIEVLEHKNYIVIHCFRSNITYCEDYEIATICHKYVIIEVIFAFLLSFILTIINIFVNIYFNESE